MVAAVAVGAFAAAAAGQTLQGAVGEQAASADEIMPLANPGDAAASMGIGGDTAGAPELLALAATSDGAIEAEKMATTERVVQEKEERLAEEEARRREAARPKYVRPTTGIFTSGFGARWGRTHYGIDIANRIGTPIVSVADGRVIEAGPAGGFGLWLRVQHDDGTIAVYGHINDYVVNEGDRVKAGELIAHMGNRGQSTGPHLHFEIWQDGYKMNPSSWLNRHGIGY
ncbi:peptidase [Actinokineospora fastidiosa]|uniref:Peptidase n=1 Tax=Actinokineospora fastidiosa TaxID=1816 RepID=A0A918LAJ7_9PSEU|nr:M23 family metallopeptidase [Actinokineospora sp. UTMC 2448]UVS82064.1 Murein hydrolase activator NlpD precursor [Actinokineospora sp. UTMC 2448]GGS23770.1 peptidase [Actinokineospora fastidiosa]